MQITEALKRWEDIYASGGDFVDGRALIDEIYKSRDRDLTRIWDLISTKKQWGKLQIQRLITEFCPKFDKS